jgi:ammonia channel protein AmtB
MLHLDTGNTGFMILCTSLVMLMTPGLAFFYGGLVGRKNVLAIMIQSFVSMGWTTVIWYIRLFSVFQRRLARDHQEFRQRISARD